MSKKEVLEYIQKNSTYIGIILSLLGIIGSLWGGYVSYDVYNKSKVVKSLQIIVLTNTPLVEIKKTFSQDVTILYKNNPSPNLSLINILIENTGNQPIVPEDFIKPLKITFSTGTKIIDEPKLLDSNPKNLDISFVVDQNSVVIPPTLINQGEKFSFQLLISSNSSFSSTPLFSDDSRIVGTKVEITDALSVIDNSDLVLGFSPSFLSAILLFAFAGGLSASLYKIYKGNPVSHKQVLYRLISGILLGIVTYLALISGSLILSEAPKMNLPLNEIIFLFIFFAGFSDSFMDSIIQKISGSSQGNLS